MEQKMPTALDISLAPERLDEGSPEERAAFGLFTIRSGNVCLTEGHDYFIDSYRTGPLVSGYHAAQWFAWNWWRLRYEPRSRAPDWDMAHRMSSIGEGYVWPNITVISDGIRTTLLSRPSVRPDAKPFRYFGAMPLVIPAAQFEAAVDAFIPRILGRLREQGLGDTNLDRLWNDLLAERSDPEVAKRRRLEALLGREPEEADEATIERLVAESQTIGEKSAEEVAAEAAKGGPVLTLDRLHDLATESGFDASPRNAVRLKSIEGRQWEATIPAWAVGAEVARALRQQENLGAAAISNRRLAELAGTPEAAITTTNFADTPISFALDSNAQQARLVLRSKWEGSRRFNLARILGDRLMADGGALHPATNAYTYRQKAQRSFAAEFLAPFEAVDAMLEGDYSEERQEDVAVHFNVSAMTINSLLKNHGRIAREESDYEFEAAA